MKIKFKQSTLKRVTTASCIPSHCTPCRPYVVGTYLFIFLFGRITWLLLFMFTLRVKEGKRAHISKIVYKVVQLNCEQQCVVFGPRLRAVHWWQHWTKIIAACVMDLKHSHVRGLSLWYQSSVVQQMLVTGLSETSLDIRVFSRLTLTIS